MIEGLFNIAVDAVYELEDKIAPTILHLNNYIQDEREFIANYKKYTGILDKESEDFLRQSFFYCYALRSLVNDFNKRNDNMWIEMIEGEKNNVSFSIEISSRLLTQLINLKCELKIIRMSDSDHIKMSASNKDYILSLENIQIHDLIYEIVTSQMLENLSEEVEHTLNCGQLAFVSYVKLNLETKFPDMEIQTVLLKDKLSNMQIENDGLPFILIINNQIKVSFENMTTEEIYNYVENDLIVILEQKKLNENLKEKFDIKCINKRI